MVRLSAELLSGMETLNAFRLRRRVREGGSLVHVVLDLFAETLGLGGGHLRLLRGFVKRSLVESSN